MRLGLSVKSVRWLMWLQAAGCLDPTIAPGERPTKGRVADYVAKLAITRAPYSQVCRVQELYDAMRVLAPHEDFHWLAELLMTLRRRATRHGAAIRSRMIDDLDIL